MRLQWRHARFKLLLVLTLGTAVGTAAAMFALVDVFLYRDPPHVSQAERLVSFRGFRSYADYLHLRDEARTVDVIAYRRHRTTLRAGDDAREALIECVSSGYFSVLGTHARAGRPPETGDGPTVLISESLRQRLGGGEGVVGRAILLGARPFVITGVAPPGFAGLQLAEPALWVDMRDAEDVCTPHGTLASGASLYIAGRMREGHARAQVEEEIRRLAAAKPGGSDRDPSGSLVRPISDDRLASVGRELRVARWAAGAAILLLLIACANYAGLLSLQAIERRREFAIRRQLGATKTRVFAQLLAEQLPIVIISAATALLVAVWVGALIRASLPIDVPSAMLNPRTLWLLLGIAAAAAAPVVMISAARAARADIQIDLRGDEPTSTRRTRTSVALLVVQSALAFTLIAGAGLMMRSAKNLTSDPGYALDRILVVTVDTRAMGYVPQEQFEAWFEAIRANGSHLDGIQSASLTSGDLLRAVRDNSFVAVNTGRPVSPNTVVGRRAPELQAITAEYFDTVGTRILKGRALSPLDTTTAPPVMILDQEQADFLFPGVDAVGQCGYLGARAGCVEIVGIVETRRYASLTDATPEVFIPLAQAPMHRFASATPRMVVLRADRPASAVDDLAKMARGIVSDPAAVIRVASLADLAGTQLTSWRMAAELFGLFGAAGILMGIVGLYASLAFAVRQRRREIGIRMALGASRRAVVTGICASAGLVVLLGALAGTAVLWTTARFATWLLFGVAPLELATLVQTSAILCLAALAGALLDPARALREH